MTGRRNIIIAVSAIVLFAAVVGFYITLDVSPQIAYARLFIDVGLSIGLVAVILAFYREPVLATDTIMQALKNLKSGKYKIDLDSNEHGALGDIASTINELATCLESQQKKQEDIKRNLREELLPNMKFSKEVTSFAHSLHPELGPVCSAADEASATPAPHKAEASFHNALIESQPPALSLPQESKESKEEQDLGELYQRFIDAQQEIELRQIEYPVFLKTIEHSRAELMKSHPCRRILFEIVKEAKQVALQPRIVR